MNPIYIAAILTPVISALTIQGVSTWFVNPQLAPPGLYKMGNAGQIYKLIIVFIGSASQFSLLGLAISGDPSFLSVVGFYIVGIISGGVAISLCRNNGAINMFFENLIMPGILTINLFMAHWLAWETI